MKNLIVSLLSAATTFAATAAPDNHYEMRCIWDFDNMAYSPVFVMAYNTDFRKTEYYIEGEETMLSLPEGNYDIMATFTRLDPKSMTGNSGKGFLIIEGMRIDRDTLVNLNASAITNRISFESYNPDGKKSRLKGIAIDGDWEERIIEPANVTAMKQDNLIMHEDFGTILHTSLETGEFRVIESPDGYLDNERNADIYVNDVSDKYNFSQTRLIIAPDEMLVVPLNASGCQSQNVTNLGQSYGERISIEFEKTPYGKECEETTAPPYQTLFGISVNRNVPLSFSEIWSNTGDIHNIRFCPGLSRPSTRQSLSYVFEFALQDSEQKTVETWTDISGEVFEEILYVRNYLHSPYLVCENNGECNFYQATDDRHLSYVPDGTTKQMRFEEPLKVHTQTPYPFNYGAPYLQFLFHNDISNYQNPFPDLIATYKGNLGERREENGNRDMTIRINGEISYTPDMNFYVWCSEICENGEPKGLYEIEINNYNIQVDGLPGSNRAKIMFDNTISDQWAPSLRSLRLYDTDGIPTISFNDNSEGTVEIYGGDFNRNDSSGFNEWGQLPFWYEHSPLKTCTIEYAPYNTDDFIPLPAERGDDNDFIHTYGIPYRASLRSVQVANDTKWYDLRITLTDSAGNQQIQTISPAFRIETLTPDKPDNVSTTLPEDNSFTVWTADGRPVLTDASAEMINALPKGIYILKAGRQIIKHMVR